MTKPQTGRVGKRGTVVIPAALRRRFGLSEGALIIAEERPDGILIRPAIAIATETYTPERKAAFLLENAVDTGDYASAKETVRRMDKPFSRRRSPGSGKPSRRCLSFAFGMTSKRFVNGCARHSREDTGVDVGRIENLSFAVDPFLAPRMRPSAPTTMRIWSLDVGFPSMTVSPARNVRSTGVTPAPTLLAAWGGSRFSASMPRMGTLADRALCERARATTSSIRPIDGLMTGSSPCCEAKRSVSTWLPRCSINSVLSRPKIAERIRGCLASAAECHARMSRRGIVPSAAIRPS